MTLYAACKGMMAWIFGSPDYERLETAIKEAMIGLLQQVELNDETKSSQGSGEEAKSDVSQQINLISKAKAAIPWTRAAASYLVEAETCLRQWNIQHGWISLTTAQREILLNSKDPDRILYAGLSLRREVEKITGWRAKAIEDLLKCLDKYERKDKKGDACKPDEADKPGDAHDQSQSQPSKADAGNREAAAAPLPPDVRKRVVDALALRDDYFATTYLKILLRRRNLFQLFLLLWAGILTFVILAALHVLPPPFNAARKVVTVILFGALGAAFSVGHGLLTADITAKIPAQQIGSFLVWMRPPIGAAAALVAFALLYANAKLKVLDTSTFNPEDFAVIATIAFVAGFSERFIVGAMERISKLSDKNDGKAK